MRILVTGGCGFIGSNLVRFLLEKEPESSPWDFPPVEKIVNLDKLTYAGNPRNLDGCGQDSRYVFHEGDIGDPALVKRILEENAIDAVMHLAAESHVDRSIDSPEAFVTANAVGSFHLLETARQYWKSLPEDRRARFRFLHVSTDEVYGSLGSDDPAFSETTPYAPNSPYAASKAASDHFARAYCHTFGLPVVTTNCSNNYGPYQFPEKLIPLIIRKAIRREPLPVYGDGSNVRDWLYVRDHCRGLTAALAAGRPGETYNIGGNSERTNIDVVKRVCDIVDELRDGGGAPRRELISFVTDRPGHDRRYAIDCRKITAELGWEPQESFETGLAKTVRWYLKNAAWADEIESGAYRGERLGAG